MCLLSQVALADGERSAPPSEVEPPPAGSVTAAPPAAVDAADWLHQPAGQQRLNRLVEVEQQEAREQSLRHRDDLAQAAYAVAYAFTPLHGLLLKMAQAATAAGLRDEALILIERLLSENPEPLLRVQATALKQAAKPADAGPSADADSVVRGHIERGKAAFQKGDYRDSIQSYASAYALQDLPRLLFNIAQAYRRLGQAEPAFLMYQRFLQADPATSLRRETEGYIAELRVLTAVISSRRAPRPKWRIISGAAALAAGLGVVGGGIAALSVDGQCAAPDGMGMCTPLLDASGRPLLPRTAQVYSTTPLGAGLIAGGGLLAVAGALLIALPGKVIPTETQVAFGPGALHFALLAHY